MLLIDGLNEARLPLLVEDQDTNMMYFINSGIEMGAIIVTIELKRLLNAV